MAQTGDGQNHNGTGGSKYPDLKAEFSNVPYKRGVVGMARKGNSNDSANSQFFIMFGEAPSLNGQYTVIGEVLSGHGRGRQDQEGRAGAEPRPDDPGPGRGRRKMIARGSARAGRAARPAARRRAGAQGLILQIEIHASNPRPAPAETAR